MSFLTKHRVGGVAGAAAGLVALGITLTATQASATVWTKQVMVNTIQSPNCIQVNSTIPPYTMGTGWKSSGVYVNVGQTIYVGVGAVNPYGGCEIYRSAWVTVPNDDLTNFWVNLF